MENDEIERSELQFDQPDGWMGGCRSFTLRHLLWVLSRKNEKPKSPSTNAASGCGRIDIRSVFATRRKQALARASSEGLVVCEPSVAPLHSLNDETEALGCTRPASAVGLPGHSRSDGFREIAIPIASAENHSCFFSKKSGRSGRFDHLQACPGPVAARSGPAERRSAGQVCRRFNPP